MPRTLRALIVEDNPVDAELIVRELSRAGFDVQWSRVESEAEYLAALDSSLELILCDYSLPQFCGVRALKLLQDYGYDIPFILVSGTVGEDVAVESMRLGVTDYLLKDRLGRLGSAVSHALDEARHRQKSRRIEEKLDQSEKRYRRLFEAAKDGILIVNAETGFVEDVNPFLVKLLGFTKEHLVSGQIWKLACFRELIPTEEKFRELQRSECVRCDSLLLHTNTGRQIEVEFVSNTYDVDGTKVIQCNIRDITARRRAEEALRISEARLRIVTERARVGLVVINADRRYIFANAAYYSLFALSDKDILGMRVADVLPTAYDQQIRPRLDQALAGNPVDYELQVPSSDGERHFAINYEPVFDRDLVTKVVVVVVDVTQQRRAATLLKIQDRAIQSAGQAIIIVDANQPDLPIIYVNDQFESFTGYTAKEAVGRNCRFLQGKDTASTAISSIRRAIEEVRPVTVELLNYRKDGKPFWNKLSITPVRDNAGRLTHFLGIQSDVTEQRNTEEQLRQSQKMDAVGQLAGGIAHDLNNMLTVIDGYTGMLLDGLSPTDAAWKPVHEIQLTSSLAAGLTRQLLAFSRRQVRTPQRLDFNKEVVETIKLVGRLIEKQVELDVSLSGDVKNIWADRGQISQIVMNLVINARDAMSGCGRLSIRTANVVLQQAKFASGLQVEPGEYVRLSVTDTGCGMPSDVQARIFEPFFTTKPLGKGTGLGLATVYGIVVQNQGCIEVLTEYGTGTTFDVYLPVLSIADENRAPLCETRTTERGAEAVLLVEDDPYLRKIATTMLARYGYVVHEAADGLSALEIFSEHEHSVQMLITDLALPQMNGQELADRLVKRKPELKILFMSGYVVDDELRQLILRPDVNFLQKPFSMKQLASKIREVLGSNPIPVPTAEG